ncbi:hypothetical protein TCAL_03273 [Tigriopus californicus]|uniref:VWFA domain-containing protein n=1 Tax=Tigriopus californicus TaxID=6832 RepID=A0A553NVG1_TIGCA|nr:hypothetical protein TCAL_03273 [Tigriopus californicus]|eukprot:TCALIF_03273-PA protein Name:"Similar to ITIH4 Inter-alpha-trypsin inhibitor heavy chain H4 (Bos taurus)" AED:0.11 eAED:0.11 QI:0/-1/0/1/-1/1/1/0/953
MRSLALVSLWICALLEAQSVFGRPQTQTLVVSTTGPSAEETTAFADIEYDETLLKGNEESPKSATPVISEFSVRSNVQLRYAKTVVEAYIKNPSAKAKKLDFTLVIPDSAFISNFSMLLKGEELVASVEEKAKAKEVFDQAVSSGQGAGLVDQDTRNANQITVSANVEGNDKVRFRLTYEELLQRRIGKYEHVVHVNPGQIVNDFKIEIVIQESLPVVHVRVPKIKTDPNAIQSGEVNPDVQIALDDSDPTKVNITYSPDTKMQKQFGTNGISGEFMVEYDVDRKEQGNEIQVIDGYFVHFFAPDSLKTLPKHVVFVLDISGSMYGEKLSQTKDAMVTVIDDLTSQDHFNIITFSDNVMHWVPENEKLKEGAHQMTYQGQDDLKTEALQYVLSLNTIGGTNINDAMVDAINLVEEVKKSEELAGNVQSMIIFLTDGEATAGVTSATEIKKNVARANRDISVPVYGLAFGSGADFGLIKTLSKDNGGFARKIYEGSDASIQLEDFYLEIASPLLSNLDIKYVGEAVKNETLTETKTNTFSEGGEIIIAGQIDETQDDVEVIITGQGKDGIFEKKFIVCTRNDGPVAMAQGEETDVDMVVEDLTLLPPGKLPTPSLPTYCFPISPRPAEPKGEGQNFVERLWAFKTIKQLLDDKKSALEERKEELGDETDEESDEESSEETSMEDKPLEESSESDDVEVTPMEDGLTLVVPPPKTNKERAIALAIQYNFVTPVTSLVVVKGKGTDSDDKQPIEVVPVDSLPRFNQGGFGFNRRFAGVQFSIASGGGFGGGFPLMRKGAPSQIVHRGQTTQQFQPTTSGLPGPPPPPFPTYPLSQPPTDNDYLYESDDVFDSPSMPPPTTSPPKTSCDGAISLYGRSGKRGMNVTLTEDEPDLANHNFSNTLASAEIWGDCCWIFYTEPNFQGKSLEFLDGPGYVSSGDIAEVFREVNSVQKSILC